MIKVLASSTVLYTPGYMRNFYAGLDRNVFKMLYKTTLRIITKKIILKQFFGIHIFHRLLRMKDNMPTEMNVTVFHAEELNLG